MKSALFIKKIRKYGIISFLVPLVTINACFLIFNLLGTYIVYPNFDWSEKKIELTYIEDFQKRADYESYGALNCPKYYVDRVLITHNNKKIRYSHYHNNKKIRYLHYDQYREDVSTEALKLELNNKIKTVLYEQNEVINNECIQNNKFLYKLLTNFNFLDKIIVKAKNDNKSGFSKVRNPYIHGEVSISRTARYYPSIIIFKFFIILSSVFLFLYWKNTLNLFNNFENKNVLNNFSKKFFYLGVLSCIFLILHASLLGLDIDTKFFKKIRRLIIILFIVFEITAQIFLTINILKFKNKIKKYIHPSVLFLKVFFVSLFFLITLISFGILVIGDPSTEFKHILEWNYFSFLLLYYLLSTLLWKTKNPVHTPEGV